MKKRYILAFFLTVLAGTALHFAYPLARTPLVGLFAPVNESVWEHLKLIFWPFLAAGFFLTRGKSDQMRAWSGVLLAQLLMPAVLCGAYYLLACGFELSALWVDILLYVLTLALGFTLSGLVCRSGRLAYLSGVLVILTGLYGAALILFALAPPELPIFMELA